MNFQLNTEQRAQLYRGYIAHYRQQKAICEASGDVGGSNYYQAKIDEYTGYLKALTG